MMARRKRGGKVSANIRKTRSAAKLLENPTSQEEIASQSPSESEESGSSGTPKSCNTPVEIEKCVSNPLPLIQHKKFGKFRCLLVDEPNKTEVSSSESEVQVDAFLEVETKDLEIISVQTDNIIDAMKSVEIGEVEALHDIPMCTSEIVEEELSIQMAETIVDDSSSSEIPLHNEVPIPDPESEESVPVFEQSDDNSNGNKSPDPNIKTSENSSTSGNDVKTASDTAEENSDSSANTVRRSSRIRSISVLKQRSKGHGLVRSEKLDKKDKTRLLKPASEKDEVEFVSTDKVENELVPTPLDSPSFATPMLGFDNDQKPVKVKSRWRRSSELEMGGSSPLIAQPLVSPQIIMEVPEHQTDSPKTEVQNEQLSEYAEEMEKRLRQFETLVENQYLTERTSCKEAKKMLCDCFLTKEEIERGEFGCGEDCLNRLLMIECGSHCIVEDRCTNKRFQKLQYAPCEVFRTQKKGFGIRAVAEIPYGEFILEYVGEVLDPDEFDKRAKEYSKDKNRHYYFMALRADAVIDATQKGRR